MKKKTGGHVDPLLRSAFTRHKALQKNQLLLNNKPTSQLRFQALDWTSTIFQGEAGREILVIV